MKIKTLLYALGLAGLTSLAAQAATVETPGFLKYDCWFSPLRDPTWIGTDLGILTFDPSYPNTPDMTSFTTGFNSRGVFPDDAHEQYGARLSGWITPTVTGDYNFYLASDDASELYLSIDATEANLQLVAQEVGCCKGFLEPGNPQTTWAPIHLEANQKYAVRILLKEGTGGDYVQVAMQSATGTNAAASLKPLISTMVSSAADPAGASLAITQQPANVATPENVPSVSFSIAATATTPFGKYTSATTLWPTNGLAAALGTKSQVDTFYQWFTNGVEVPGANSTNYTIAWPKLAQNGMKVKCYVAVPGIPMYSTEATLTVNADTTPPTVVSAKADATSVRVLVKYSEPVSDSALLASHYTLDQGGSVSTVDRVDAMTVRLNTSRLAEGRLYTLTINGVQDSAIPGNTIAANTQVQFRSWVFVPGVAIRHKYKGFDNSTGDNVTYLFNDPRYPNNPDRIDLVKRVEYPADGAAIDNVEIPETTTTTYKLFYDALDCWFVPPATGNYVFLTAAPDRTRLFLSTDESPANKKLIASEDTWTGVRTWGTDHAGVPTTGGRSDQYVQTQWPGGNTITLQGGQRYYIELIHHMPSWAGGQWLAATYKKDTDPDPATGTVPTLERGAIGSYMDPTVGSVAFSLQPTNVTVASGTKASFYSAASGSSAYTTNVFYQWQSAPKGSSTFTDVAGATAATYTTDYLGGSADGTQYRVMAMVPPLTATSSVATLTVQVDSVPPTVVRAWTDLRWTNVTVKFSEPISDTALAAARYGIDKGVAVSSVSRVDVMTVRLVTSALVENQVYTLTINGVQDMATPPNTIAPNTRVELRSLVFLSGAALHQKYTNVNDGTGSTTAGLFNDPRYPYSPNRADVMLRFEYPANGIGRDQTMEPTGIAYRNYFDTTEGYFIPPQNGDYVFFMAGADRFWLYLSTDESPANKHLIAAQPGGWTNPRQWMTGQGTTDMTAQRSDTYTGTQWPYGNTITLQAGRRYYMEEIHHDPSWCGADDFAATFKLSTEADPVNGDAPRLTGSLIGYYFDPSGSSITFTAQPQNASVIQGQTATFTTAATANTVYANLAPTYQWQSAPKGSSAWTDIAGATATSYTTPVLDLVNDGAQFRVVASLPFYAATSSVAMVSVAADVVPPTVVSVRRSFTNDTVVVVVFSEKLDPATANDPTKYTISTGFTVSAAVLQADGRTVLLTVSPAIAQGASATLTVNGVKDFYLNPVAPNTQLAVGFERGALFVLNNTDPITVNASDALILSRLQSRGYYVQAVGSTNDNVTMAADKHIVIISSTVNSGNVAATYKATAVPFITCEQAIQDDMAMTTVTGTTDRGTTTGQTALEIVDANHPLAAGLPAGQVTVTTSVAEFAWGQPNTNAHAVAKLVGTAGNFGIYGYEKGALLTDGTAAAERRVLFFTTDNVASVLNSAGWKLFDAAVDWAQGLSAASPPRLSASISAGNIVISWSPAGGRLESTTTLGGAWTDAGSANPATIPMTGAAKFFRVVTP